MLEFSSDLALWQITILSLVSLVVGLLGGFVGLALGTMRLPGILLTGLNPQVAAGTNILVSALAALSGGYRHLRERRVDWSVVLWLGVPSVVGAFVGGLFSGEVPASLLISLVGLLVLWQGIEFLGLRRRLLGQSQTKGAVSATVDNPRSHRAEKTTAGTFGLSIGLLGGAVGLILGSLRLPLMIKIMRMDPRKAAGSNLIIGASLGLFGFAGHGIRGEVDLPLLLSMGLAGMVGSYVGARYTGRVSIDSLMLVLAWVLAIVGIILVGQGILEALD